jgi:phospholipid/cholesterol/gamma-HCH transport system ATP-binding protein
LSAPSSKTPAISVRDLVVGFGDRAVLDGVTFDVARGNVTGVVGPSGSGKTVTMRALPRLVPVTSGSIHILGQDPADLDRNGMRALKYQIGVLFQQGALFSSLTVQENVEIPMREHLGLDAGLMVRAARAKIDMAGLPQSASGLYPSELSGGMIKRAALARALALDPTLLFLDEPTAGLDPIAASAFDSLVLDLRAALDLTVFMITHDLDSLGAICNDVIAMAGGKILSHGSLNDVRSSTHPWISEYFGGPRAQRLGGLSNGK